MPISDRELKHIERKQKEFLDALLVRKWTSPRRDLGERDALEAGRKVGLEPILVCEFLHYWVGSGDLEKSWIPVAESIQASLGPDPFKEVIDDSDGKASSSRTIRVFLASSNELKRERDEIEKLVGRENRRLRVSGIFLDLVLWEDLLQSFRPDRYQAGINEQLETCDVMICLFFSKVGRFTREEFDIAYQRLKAGKKPQFLYVFFKSGRVDIDRIDEDTLKIQELKKEIKDEEQIYKQFESDQDLILQLKNQFELIVSDDA